MCLALSDVLAQPRSSLQASASAHQQCTLSTNTCCSLEMRAFSSFAQSECQSGSHLLCVLAATAGRASIIQTTVSDVLDCAWTLGCSSAALGSAAVIKLAIGYVETPFCSAYVRTHNESVIGDTHRQAGRPYAPHKTQWRVTTSQKFAHSVLVAASSLNLITSSSFYLCPFAAWR
jgi:hypothetical protein